MRAAQVTATAKDTHFYRQGKALFHFKHTFRSMRVDFFLHFHCKVKTCKSKRHFYPCSFKPGQSHALLCYCINLHSYLYIISYLEAVISEVEHTEKVFTLAHPGDGGSSSESCEVPAPSYASQTPSLFRSPMAHGGSNERQSWSSDQSVQLSNTRQLSSGLTRQPSWHRAPRRARVGTKEAAGPNSQELRTGKKERAKQASHF